MLLEDFYITLPGSQMPDHTDVLEYAEKHPSSNAKPLPRPAWATLCLLVGALLSVGAGAFLVTVGLMLS